MDLHRSRSQTAQIYSVRRSANHHPPEKSTIEIFEYLGARGGHGEQQKKGNDAFIFMKFIVSSQTESIKFFNSISARFVDGHSVPLALPIAFRLLLFNFLPPHYHNCIKIVSALL